MEDAQQRETSLLGRISALEDQLVNEKATFVNKEEELKSENLSLEAQITDLSAQLKSREEENNLLASSSAEMQNKLQNLEENYGQQKNGFVEELNKMNDVLKQRGEAITRLEEKCQTSEKDFKVKTETLLQLVAEKERKIEQLESEVNRFETQSEMMSTSTVCKVEEIHRMKDVEDSLEDRYNKLKMLAVRMKKKISEQNTQIQEKDNQIAVLKSDEKGNNNRNNPLNMQAVQKDIDRLNDELDTKKAEMKLLKKDCENAIKELANSKQMAEEFKNEASVLKITATNLEKSKAALENSNQELRTLYEDSRKENESEKIVRAELSRECDRFKNEIRQLNNTIEELNKTNQAVKQESKKQSVLELELTDYEKSVSELNGKLDSLQKELSLKQNLYEKINDEKTGLKDQVQLLEQQINTELQRATELKMALDATRLQLDASQSEVKQQRIEIRTVTEKAESKESEVDNLKIKLSEINSELHKIQTTSALHIDALRKQIFALEESLTFEKAAKDSLQLECSELRAEYENYKIRAMSVLKKKKTEEQPCLSSKETVDDLNTDQVEREMLQRVVDALKAKVTELESQLALSQSEVSSLRMEKERTAVSQAATVEAMQQRLGRAETEMEVVKREHQGQIARLQGDNQLLASLHREQIDGLKIRHSQEMIELENKLDEFRLETTRLQKLVTSANSNRTASPLIKGDQRRDEVIFDRERDDESDEESLHRRQATENNQRKPMPLDLLLNSTLGLEETIVSQSESEPISIDKYNESLAIVEKRCNHLAALLAESEANEARLSQLTDALKEEIRRSERAEERQKHIENLEYLKNVVLKFVTLPRGEERSRLIPVLTTLLRLSPAEVQEVHQTFTRADGVVRPMAWGGVFNYFAPNQ